MVTAHAIHDECKSSELSTTFNHIEVVLATDKLKKQKTIKLKTP